MTVPDLSPETLRKLRQVFNTYPELTQVKLFGSRATGKASARSDIDLVTLGIVDQHRLGRLALELEDIDVAQKCDLQAYESIHHAPLKAHIDTFGITIYRQASALDPMAMKP